MIRDIGIKTIAIVQARENSLRLPDKILKKINGISVLELLIYRISKCKKIDKIVIACTSLKKDKNIIEICKKLNIEYYIGSTQNVLSRYYKCSKKFKSDYILRITSDCPFIDPSIIDKMIDKIQFYKYDYVSNTLNPKFPDGLDAEIFNFKTLEYSYFNAKKSFDKEHVTPFMKLNKKFKKFSFEDNDDLSSIRLTIDENKDLKMLKKTYKELKYNKDFKYKEIKKIFKKNPNFFNLNKSLVRDSGSKMKKSQKLWKRANDIIPDGNMLLSKRPQTFTNNKWPTYFKKSSGYYLWDLDGKKYRDFSYMGVGTNLLGYSNNKINKAVKKIIDKGNVSTLNSVEEIYLTEKLLKIHKWAGMVKYAKTGGEAATIALRIARSFNNKDKVIVCGYHGWHDWYLSAQLTNKGSLANHLFKNLKIKGVPKFLRHTSFAFNYNDTNMLNKIINKNKNKVSALIMEVERNIKPKKNFFKYVNKICRKNNIVLILDECTSGFRENIGGLHLKYKINPDIVLYGKAMSNGYPITAILGKKKIMLAAKNTFISSTYWTDRIGFQAALKTIEEMERLKPWKKIITYGKFVKKKWKNIFEKYNLKVKIFGLDTMPSFLFLYKHNLYRQYFTDEMLKKGYLATNSFYISVPHSLKSIKEYLINFEKVIEKISINYKKINSLSFKKTNSIKRLN